MADKEKTLTYEKSDKQSIYHYALGLRGFTLREKTGVGEIADIRRNKGSFGSTVEARYFMLDLNSSPGADLAARAPFTDGHQPPHLRWPILSARRLLGGFSGGCPAPLVAL